MISRTSFVVLINSLLSQIEKEDRLSKSLDSFFDGNFVSTISTGLVSDIINVLNDELGADNDILEWWLFDAPEAGKNREYAHIEDDGKVVKLETSEQLYNYLTKR